MRILLLLFCVAIVYGAPASPGHGLCEVCHLLVGEVQDLLTTGQTQNAIRSYVSSACSKLRSEEKDVCNNFLTQHSGTLFHRLIKDLTPYEFCERLTGVCPASYEEPEVQTEEVDEPTANPLECELCKLAVLGIDRLIKQNRSSAAINDTLEKFCQGLPDKIKDVCVRVEPDILKGLSTGFDPKIACKFATLCSAAAGNNEVTPISCDACYTVMDAIGIKDTESICASQPSCIEESEAERRQQESVPEVQGTLECQICKFAVQSVDTLLGENRSVVAINNTLFKLCDSLPEELKYSCLNVEPDILKAVLGGIDPSKSCDFLKICNDKNTVPVSSQFIPCEVCLEALEAVAGEKGVQQCYKFKDVCGLEAPESEPQAEETVETPICDLCQFLIKSVSDLVQTDRSRDTVAGLLDFVCYPLPEQAKTFCTDFRSSIIDQVVGGVKNAKQSCDDIEICKDHERDIFAEEETEGVTEDARCELCKFMVQLLDQTVESNSSMAKINTTLFDICNALPSAYKTLCVSVVPQLEAAIAAGLDPTNTCIASSFCTPTTRLVSIEELKCETCARFVEGLSDEAAIEVKSGVCKGVCRTRARRSADKESVLRYRVQQILHVSKLKGAAECDLCHLFIRTIDDFVGENSSLETINKTVNEICTRLAGIQLQKMCLQEQPVIVKLLKDGIDPIKACIDAKLCTQGRIQKRSVSQLKEEAEEDRETNNIESELLDVVKSKVQNNVGDLACDICEGVVELLDRLIEENATDDKINQTLYQLCSGLPDGALKDLCLQEAPEIMAAVEDGFDPEKTCELAKLCTDASKIKERSQKKMDIESARTKAEDSPLLDMLTSRQREEHNVGDLACDICKEVVQLLDGLIEENATDDKINETLYKLCSGLPDGALKDLCLQEAPLIMTAVENGFDPDKTCELAKLCTGNRRSGKGKSMKVFKQVRKHIEENSRRQRQPENVNNLKDLRCSVCEIIIKEVDIVIEQNGTMEKINKTVYSLCNRLQGALKDLCLQAAPQVVNVLANGADPSKVCAVLGLCSTNVFMEVTVDKNDADAKCEICELIIQGLDEVIRTNTSTEKVNETIYSLCSGISGTAKTFCILVAPTVVSDVKNGVDPKIACATLKLCITTKQTEVVNRDVGDIKCDICELLLKEINALVGQNASDEKINTTIYNLCNDLGGTPKRFCQLVAPEIVKAVESGVDPEKTCETLKLCTSTEQQSDVRNNVGDVKCDICELVIKEADKLVGDNATDEKINATIYKLCNDLGGTFKAFCQLVAPGIVKAVESGVDPEKGCETLKLCTTSSEQESNLKKNVGDIKCDICELVIKELDTLVGKNATDDKVNATIYNLCSYLDGTAKTFCTMLAPQIVKEIEAGADPEKACDTLKLCTSVEQESNLKKNVGDIKCDICELVIKELDTLVGKNASDEKVNATIYNLCSYLDGTAKTFCTMLAPQIVKEIEGGADPEKACDTLKLCTSVDLPIQHEKVGDLKCELCELIVNRVDQALGKNASRQQINSTIYNVCEELSDTFKVYCLVLAPAIVKALEDGATDPFEACEKIKICTTEIALRDVLPEVRRDPIDCKLCARSLEAVYEDISGNYMKVKRQLLRLCSNLPVVFRSSCEELIESDHGRLYKMVLTHYTPVSLCEMANCHENEELLTNNSS